MKRGRRVGLSCFECQHAIRQLPHLTITKFSTFPRKNECFQAPVVWAQLLLLASDCRSLWINLSRPLWLTCFLDRIKIQSQNYGKFCISENRWPTLKFKLSFRFEPTNGISVYHVTVIDRFRRGGNLKGKFFMSTHLSETQIFFFNVSVNIYRSSGIHLQWTIGEMLSAPPTGSVRARRWPSCWLWPVRNKIAAYNFQGLFSLLERKLIIFLRNLIRLYLYYVPSITSWPIKRDQLPSSDSFVILLCPVESFVV